LQTEAFQIRLPNGCWSDLMQSIPDPTNVLTEVPKGEYNAEMYAKAQQLDKEAHDITGAIWLAVLFCPALGLFAVGKGSEALCCLLLQFTGVGWIPAIIWAIISISTEKSEKHKHAALLARMANRPFEEAVGLEHQPLKKIGIGAMTAFGFLLWLNFTIWMLGEGPRQLQVIRTHGWITATIWAIVTISMYMYEKHKHAALLERMANRPFEEAVGPDQMIRMHQPWERIGLNVMAALGFLVWLNFTIWMLGEGPRQLQVIRNSVSAITSRN
jgi:hypothetical protein